MKRIVAVVLVCTVALWSATLMSAQKYGVTGGATFSSMRNIENSSKTGWNVGGTVQFKLPLGFSIQPSLIYNTKASQVDLPVGKVGLDVGYLELPVSFQWGPDLLVFRPFVEVSPFVGYALSSRVSHDALPTPGQWKTSYLQRMEYGLGLGGGLEIWRLQLTCRYNWNFGPLFNGDGRLDFQHVEEAFDGRNFGGVTLSLAFLFGK